MSMNKKSIRTITIWVIGIGIGAAISIGLNRLIMNIYLNQEVDYTQTGTTNWYIAIPVFVLLLLLVITGFYLGKVVEK